VLAGRHGGQRRGCHASDLGVGGNGADEFADLKLDSSDAGEPEQGLQLGGRLADIGADDDEPAACAACAYLLGGKQRARLNSRPDPDEAGRRPEEVPFP
jgi:hypothetical protein